MQGLALDHRINYDKLIISLTISTASERSGNGSCNWNLRYAGVTQRFHPHR